jgi:hypothetical protein
LILAGIPASAVQAQPGSPQPASPQPAAQRDAATDRSPADPEARIAALGAETFAAREQAAADVMAAGAAMLPALQEAAESHPDLEIRMRSQILYRRVARHDFESRAARFLASESPGDLMPGWPAVAPLLGDHSAARELYIEISRDYPALAAAYGGTPRDRAAEADLVATAVAEKMMQHRMLPDPADAVALLLIAADPAVPVSLPVERTLLSLVNKASVTTIRNQTPLAPRFDELMSAWIRRSLPEHRQEVLWRSMQDDLEAGGALALRTLHETDNPAVLQMALQAAARFAQPKDTPLIVHLLDDQRPAGDGVAAIAEGGERIETRISDVAMATIARIHDASLADLGFRYARTHPKVAFVIESLGFPANDEAARQAVRQQIDALTEPAQR